MNSLSIGSKCSSFYTKLVHSAVTNTPPPCNMEKCAHTQKPHKLNLTGINCTDVHRLSIHRTHRCRSKIKQSTIGVYWHSTFLPTPKNNIGILAHSFIHTYFLVAKISAGILPLHIFRLQSLDSIIRILKVGILGCWIMHLIQISTHSFDNTFLDYFQNYDSLI